MKDSIEQIKEALKISPENNDLRLMLADSLLHEDRFDEAEEEYKKILTKDEKHFMAKAGLAGIYFHNKQYNIAALLLEELIQRSESTLDLELLYAKTLLRERNFLKAKEIYQSILERDPEYYDEELDKALRIGELDSWNENLDFLKDYENDDWFLLEKPDIKFQHVGGMQKIKDEIKLKIIFPLQHKAIYEAYGKTTGGGILLYGPPGCGKTFIARATAGEIDAQFVTVDINEVLDMWIGNSEKNLHEIFDVARQNKPCVLFIDEMDAIGTNRNEIRQSSVRNLVNQFLFELDGIHSNNEGILTLAATNAPWQVDNAFRRPGRFDRILFVAPPDESERSDILKIYMADKPQDDIDWSILAAHSRHFSGADLRAVIDIAVECKIPEAIKLKKPIPLNTEDLLDAIHNYIPSTLVWLHQAFEASKTSSDIVIYQPILQYLKRNPL
ncbi:MAG: AAA family ATPase [Saprospiraceae bacterium]|nr:AAA family ATPase [Saprospiraceae bacterium]